MLTLMNRPFSFVIVRIVHVPFSQFIPGSHDNSSSVAKGRDIEDKADSVGLTPNKLLIYEVEMDVDERRKISLFTHIEVEDENHR